MDTSKSKLTQKSTETPWSPEHERSKLKEKAGTVWTDPFENPTFYDDARKSWAGKGAEEIKSGKLPKDRDVEYGKSQRTGKAIKKRGFGGLGLRKKGKESEY